MSTHSIIVEVLSPSSIEYEKPISTISIVNNTKRESHKLDNDSVQFIKMVAQHWAENFSNEITKHEISDSVFFIDQVSTNAITDTLLSDFIVNINDINIKFFLTEEDLQYQSASHSDYSEVLFDFSYNINYSIFNNKTKEIVFEKSQSDHKGWSEMYRNNDSIKYHTPDEIEIIRLTVNELGKEASYVFFSEWKSVKRSYYSSKEEDLVLAEYYASVKEWKKAAEIWSEHAQTQKKEAKYFTYNMAFASEMEGNLEAAIYWAKRSSEELYNRKAAKYLIELEKRQKEQDKLIQQLGEPE